MDEYIVVKQFKDFSVKDPFFESLSADYEGFEKWFARKTNENAFIVAKNAELKAFMYVKKEDEPIELTDEENLEAHERIKFGTFKINSTGTILGDRFLGYMLRKIVSETDIDECYVTVFDKHNKTIRLFERFGFEKVGHNLRGEWVLVKYMKKTQSDDYKNFPKISISNSSIHQLAFYPTYHDKLFPESRVKGSNTTTVADEAPSNTITKTYLSSIKSTQKIKSGDILVVYRTNPNKTRYAAFNSVASAVGKVLSVKNIDDFSSFEEFISYIGKGTVFSLRELQMFWQEKKYKYLIKFIYNFSLKKRPILIQIKEIGATPDVSYAGEEYWGHATYTKEQFLKLLEQGDVNESFIIN